MLSLACLLAASISIQPASAQSLADYVSPVDPVEEYLDAIDDIEADYGPYAEELSDMYLGLGQTLIDAGEYEKARDAFHRAVTVQRVNQGPNNPEQTNHLYVLANIESVLGEFSAADQAMNNIYHINADYYGEDSPEMLPVLKRIYQWYHLMRPLGSDIAEFEDFLRNVEITEEILRISEMSKGPEHPDTATAYRRYGEANFQMVLFLSSMVMSPGTDSYVGVSSGSSLVTPEVDTVSIGEYYSDGRRTFRNYLAALAANPSTTPADMAEAMAQIGDWYQLVEKFGKSIDHYEEGYRVLAKNEGFTEQAETYMSQPKPMDFIFDVSAVKLQEALAEAGQPRIEVSMTVTSMGTLRSIELLNTPEELTKAELSKIKRGLERIPFRPALKDGEVVTTRSFIWQYDMPPEESTS